MGFLKSITRPISKVLDKIIPNEIKPALPYLAAFAPFYMPPGMQFAKSGIFSNPMFTRALMSGAANLGSQLSQEGSEGDFNPFSVAMASGVGALGAQNAPEFFQGMQKGPTGVDQFGDISVPYSDTGIMASVSDAIGKGGASAAKFIGEAGDVLRPGGKEVGLNLETLQAAGVPISQATGDLAEADARRALRDYENEMANQDQLSLIDDDGRRRAIRAAMKAAGHLEEIIVDTLAELGLKDGGVVKLKHGGISSVLPKGREADYRGGGVIPVGSRERADDVPARLSKNEFVFTADAVRNAGGGDIDKGAEIMERVMENLEQGGQVSEETQGMGGAQQMFETSERLSEVV